MRTHILTIVVGILFPVVLAFTFLWLAGSYGDLGLAVLFGSMFLSMLVVTLAYLLKVFTTSGRRRNSP